MLLRRCIVLGLTLLVSAQADWSLLHPRDAADSSSARRLYGIRAIRNAMSSATVRVAAGSVVLEAGRIASDTALPCPEEPCRLQGWSARVGFEHPLFPDGRIRDLKGMRSISFEFRNKEPITGYLGVGLGSSAIPESLDAVGYQFEARIGGSVLLATGTEWKKAQVDVTDFAKVSWWDGDPDLLPPFDTLLAHARSLRFIPYSGYLDSGVIGQQMCARCAVPNTSSQLFEVRNIVLNGAEKYPDPPVGDCRGGDDEKIWIDALFDDHENEVGGKWFRYLDSDSTDIWGHPKSSSFRGRSVAWDSLIEGDAFNAGLIRLDAALTPRDAGTDGFDDAWAAIGTGFCALGWSRAISFHLDADNMPSSVEGVRMVLHSYRDSISMMIPSRWLVRSGGTSICFTPDSDDTSRIASRVNGRMGMRDVTAIVWEARTNGLVGGDLPTRTSFSVSDAKVYDFEDMDSPMGRTGGLGCGHSAAVRRRAAQHGASVSWSAGVLSLRGAADASVARVVGLDGRQVASFAPAARLPLSLSRGTWILELQRRNGRIERLPFVVLGR